MYHHISIFSVKGTDNAPGRVCDGDGEIDGDRLVKSERNNVYDGIALTLVMLWRPFQK
jgi:hypothetical protein